MPYFEHSGVRLFYADYPPATGPRPGRLTLLLVHGLWGAAEGWIHQIPALRTRYRTMAVDLRGHGRSGAPPAGYDLGDHAEDLAALIRHAELAPVVVLAHSMGCSVSTVLAARHPTLVHALALIDPDYAGDPGEREWMSRLADDLEGPDADRIAQDLISDRFHTPATPEHLRTWHLLDVLARPAWLRARTFRHSAFGPSSLRFRPEAEPMLRRRRQPVLAFHRHPARAEVERSCLTRGHSRIVRLPHAGHYLHQERPDEINRTLMQWLAALPR
ncbi:alpha/beta hydrolase [Nonomuraea sp. WAC 01424]|uniref:alpha/beta fold hydrolase n=1 Tax=Nonomuraea sp. WAC 01424 TaxID=2203200 RepID=UPI000F78E037|nr:alpha/beta hydrolase [Nonomuraea sp. WAC 01424]RSM99464.1 alpha/beta hydrolase [Nonomuraea sp. WAC 01424]